MKVGDQLELSLHRRGYLYHKISGWMKTLQLGGTFPIWDDPDVQIRDCLNPMNRVKIELRRVKEGNLTPKDGRRRACDL